MESLEVSIQRSKRRVLRSTVLFIAPAAVMAPLMWRAEAIEPAGMARHLAVVCLTFFVFFAVMSALRDRPFILLRPIVALAAALAWTTIIILQLAALVTVDAWGHLLTWPMAASYLREGSGLFETFGVPLWALAMGALGIGAATLFAFCTFRRSHLDLWQPAGVVPVLRDIAMLVAAFGVAAYLVKSSVAIDRSAREPIALFFAPGDQHSVLQNWSIAPSPVLEARQEAERRSYVADAPLPLPNIVLIVMDAMREDRLGINGYARPITPNIDKWASAPGAVVAPMFRSVCAETSCGLLSIARSRYPWEMTPVDFSLYEVLKKYGYRNRFYLSGDFTNFYGLREAFTPYDSYVDSTTIRGGALNDDRAIVETLRSTPRFDGTPTFFQFQLMSAHGLGKRHADAAHFVPQISPYTVHLRRRLPENVSTAEIVNFYDNGVAELDVQFGRVIEILRQKGFLEDALVIVTGDHGELLGEGGFVTHARSTEEAVLAPPFIMRRLLPSNIRPAGATFPRLSSQVDVAPTILHAIGAPVPDVWSGAALQNAPAQRAVYFAQGHERGLYAALESGIYKAVLSSEDSTLRVRRSLGSVNLGPEIGAVTPDRQRQYEIWRNTLKKEIGPSWVAQDGGI